MMNWLWKNVLRQLWLFVTMVFVVLFMSVFFTSAQTPQYPNPIVPKDLFELIDRVLNYSLLIVIPLAALAIIIVGVRFVLAAASGNPGKIQQAKDLLFWTVVGTAVVVGALVIANAVVNFVKTL